MRLHRAAAAIAALSLVLPEGAGALMSLRPGDLAPPFELRDLEGRPTSSAALAGAPAVVLFWSTWSPRSAEMLEDFKRHAETYGGKGLRIVAVNSDGENLGAERQTAVRAYAAARALPFPVLLDEDLRVFAAWGVMAHPTQVVLDAGGRITYVLPGYPLSLREELEEAIRNVLGIAVAPRRAQTVSVGYVPPGLALQHYNTGRQLLAREDLDGALAALRRAAAADPGFLEAALLSARVALASGDLAEAEQLARQASPETINRGDLRYLLGGLMLAKGDPDAAERAFGGLRERFPREGWGEWGLGQVALARGDRSAALAFFRAARALQPENPEAEALVRRHFRARWLRRERTPEDQGFIEIFPALGDMLKSYDRLFGAADSPAAAP